MSLSTTPSDLANAARCWSSCVPPGEQSALKTYLLAQAAFLETCTGPSIVDNLAAGTVTTTTIPLTWTPSIGTPAAASYLIQWGTTAGVYTDSGTSAVTSFTLTGLTVDTTYFILVTPIGADGCPGTPSPLTQATSNGSNGLLSGLVSYWKFDNVSAISTPDSVGANTLTLSSSNSGVAGGIINGDLDVGAGASFASHVDNADFSPGANTSFAISIWIRSSNWTGGGGADTLLLAKANNVNFGPYQIYIDAANNLICGMFDSGISLFSITLSGAPTNNVWHHVVINFDSPAKEFKGYYDGALISTKVTNTTSMFVGVFDFQIGAGAGHAALPNLMDETGMWHRSLTLTDVTNLYNGGLGLPFSSFGP